MIATIGFLTALLALVTLDLYPEVGQSKTRHLLQTMAAALSNTTVWHKSLQNITIISGENLDNTSDPRHFRTIQLVPKCPDNSAPVPKCLADT